MKYQVEWKVEQLYQCSLEQRLNELVKDGWRIWPQCIYSVQMEDYVTMFVVVVSKDQLVEDQ